MILARALLRAQPGPSLVKGLAVRSAFYSERIEKVTSQDSPDVGPEHPVPTREQLMDLSRYDPFYDFKNDKTLPGGNPYAKENTNYKSLQFRPATDLAEPSEVVQFTESLGITEETFKKLRKKVLVIKRTVNMTAKGKIPTMTALVVVGNGTGGAGIGEAKNEEAGKAIKKATERAIKNMIQFERYDNRTIFHDIEYKFKATKLKLFARPPGFGVRTNHNIHEVCHCLGITDLAGKVYGSCNPMNVIKAFFDALLSQNTPGNIAKSRGKKVVDVQFQYYGVKTKYADY